MTNRNKRRLGRYIRPRDGVPAGDLCGLPGDRGPEPVARVDGSSRRVFTVAAVPRTLACLLVGLLASSLAARAETRLELSELQITSSPAIEARPTLGADSTTPIVVYTRSEITNDGLSLSDIYYQRFAGGVLVGSPVLISDELTDDRINDISDGRIVYTALVPQSIVGIVKVYDIATAATIDVSGYVPIHELRIHGDSVVWVQGTESTRVMLSDLGTGVGPITLAGPDPLALDADVGDRFVVWHEHEPGTADRRIGYYDLLTGASGIGSDVAGLDEFRPSTAGPWIAWQEVDRSAPAPIASRLMLLNVLTGELRVVADDGSFNQNPTLDGNYLAYESNRSGDFDVYLYRISSEETFRVTSHPAAQVLNHLFGDHVAYVDERNGNIDVFVTQFTETGQIRVDPTRVDLGCVESSSNPLFASVRIYNDAEVELNVSEISLATGAFFLEGTPPSLVIPGGQSAQVNLSVVPFGSGSIEDTLLLRSDDPSRPLVEVPLSVLATRPSFTLDRAAYTFSDVATIETSLPGLVRVTSTTDPVGMEVPLDGPGPGCGVSGTFGFTVGPSDAATKLLQVRPADTVSVSVAFRSSLGLDTVTILGPAIEVSPVQLLFGDVEVGAADTQLVVLTNAGNAQLEVFDATTGSAAPTFAVQPPALPVLLAPGGEIDLAVSFMPPSEGTFAGVLSLFSDDPITPLMEIPVAGAGVRVEPPPDEGIQEILMFFDEAVQEGTLVGQGNGNSANNRLRALRNMLESAEDLIAGGDTAGACDQLQSALVHADGQPRPNDFVSGEAALDLAGLIQTLQKQLGCP